MEVGSMAVEPGPDWGMSVTSNASGLPAGARSGIGRVVGDGDDCSLKSAPMS